MIHQNHIKMEHTATTTSSFVYIEKVNNLYIDKIELATATHIYIEKVENLHASKVEPTIIGANHNGQSTTHPEPSTKPTLTTSQLVLAFYYGLKSCGIHPRVNVDIAFIARLMHLATAKPYTDVHNSEFYKRLRYAPNFKTDRTLIKDLEVIKGRLLELGLKEAASLVGNEIILALQEISNNAK
jgi:hypothetical protein